MPYIESTLPGTKELDTASKVVTLHHASATKYFSKVINNQSMGEKERNPKIPAKCLAPTQAKLAVSLYI